MSRSVNNFSRKTQAKGAGPWSGPNLSPDALGADSGDGQAFGTDIIGGMAHFKVTNQKAASGSFARRSITKGSGSFSSRTSRSSNSFARRSPAKGGQGWTGDNLTSDEYGFDNPDGMAYGGGEYGGIKHFEKIKDRA